MVLLVDEIIDFDGVCLSRMNSWIKKEETEMEFIIMSCYTDKESASPQGHGFG